MMTTRKLLKLEELLGKIDGKQRLVIGGDYNVIDNPKLDQLGHAMNERPWKNYLTIQEKVQERQRSEHKRSRFTHISDNFYKTKLFISNKARKGPF
jgi:hypothetical protein